MERIYASCIFGKNEKGIIFFKPDLVRMASAGADVGTLYAGNSSLVCRTNVYAVHFTGWNHDRHFNLSVEKCLAGSCVSCISQPF